MKILLAAWMKILHAAPVALARASRRAAGRCRWARPCYAPSRRLWPLSAFVGVRRSPGYRRTPVGAMLSLATLVRHRQGLVDVLLNTRGQELPLLSLLDAPGAPCALHALAPARAWSTMDQFVVHGTPAPLSTMSQLRRLSGAQNRHVLVEAPDTCLGQSSLDWPMTQPSRSDKGSNHTNKD
jgi:hypothetical protein